MNIGMQLNTFNITGRVYIPAVNYKIIDRVESAYKRENFDSIIF